MSPKRSAADSGRGRRALRACHAPREFAFPADHGAHDGFRTEWWYVTGNLFAADGRAFGVQLTFFRNALHCRRPSGRRPDGEPVAVAERPRLDGALRALRCGGGRLPLRRALRARSRRPRRRQRAAVRAVSRRPRGLVDRLDRLHPQTISRPCACGRGTMPSRSTSRSKPASRRSSRANAACRRRVRNPATPPTTTR